MKRGNWLTLLEFDKKYLLILKAKNRAACKWYKVMAFLLEARKSSKHGHLLMYNFLISKIPTMQKTVLKELTSISN